MGVSAEADEGAYGWHYIALLIAKIEVQKYKHYPQMRMRVANDILDQALPTLILS